MQDTRRQNLRALATQWGGVGKLAEKLGYANASFLVQMCGPHPIREVTERTARRVEQVLDLPSGWLDEKVHDAPQAIDSLVVELIHASAEVIRESGVNVPSAKLADIVAIAYEHCAPIKRVDKAYIKTLVSLLK